jgi:S1-C subfamily serine protease
VNLPEADGALVRDVGPGGPAAAAGIRPGDVITALNGQKTRTLEKFLGALHGTEPGEKARLEFISHGKASAVTVSVGAPPGSG